MDQQSFEVLKKISAFMTQQLKTGHLSDETRHEFERLLPSIHGQLARSWVPHHVAGRVVMATVFIAGAYGLFVGKPYYAYIWVTLPIFSPRILAYCGYFSGKLFGFLRLVADLIANLITGTTITPFDLTCSHCAFHGKMLLRSKVSGSSLWWASFFSAVLLYILVDGSARLLSPTLVKFIEGKWHGSQYIQ